MFVGIILWRKLITNLPVQVGTGTPAAMPCRNKTAEAQLIKADIDGSFCMRTS